MQVSVEDVQGLERRLKVSLPLESVNKVVEECFQKAARNIKIDGFRPGKVPRSLLESRYGYSIRNHEAVPKLIDNSLWDAFKEAKVEPMGRPMLEGSIELMPNQPLNYSVLFDIKPEIELKDLKGKSVEQIASEVSDADLDKAIDQLRQEHATWTEITTPAQKDDQLSLSYIVEIDGETVDLEKAEKLTYTLGKESPAIIPELAEKLIGLSAGDEKIVKATFPAEYPAESVAGKKAEFAVTIHSVSRSQLPELTEEFIKKFDGAASLEEFRDNIRKSMVYYLKNALDNVNKISLYDALAEVNPIDLPKSMVQAEVEEMTRGFLRSMFRKNDISEEEVKKYLPIFGNFYKKRAESRVRLNLLVEKFLQLHPQKITDEMINKMAEEHSALYQDPKAWLAEHMSVAENKNHMHHALLELEIANRLRESATVNEVRLDYFAVIQKEKDLQNRGFDNIEPEEEHVHDENCQHGHDHDHHGDAHHHAE